MKFLNFFKKKKENQEKTPYDVIGELIDYMPEIYLNSVEYKDCIHYYQNKDLELTIKCLIKLVDESGHYFPNVFWNNLRKVTNEMNLKAESEFSNKQLERNAKDLKLSFPLGWTVSKNDDAHYTNYISNKLTAKEVIKRHEKDKVYKLITKDGIHKRPCGPDGFIYYVNNLRLTEFYYDRNSGGVCIYFEEVDDWILPIKKSFTDTEKIEIKCNLVSWGEKNKILLSFHALH
ncbi:hypothetical protein BH11BAC3_BH11BAC3_31800 [soil metagenome]